MLLVRLVRACGSKLFLQIIHQRSSVGQARKSLWIETHPAYRNPEYSMVRLVRACGSKLVWKNKPCNEWLVRLVRACGSKQYWKI